MTEATMKARFAAIEMDTDALQDRITEIQEDIEMLGKEAAQIESDWLKTHSCACGLHGIPCVGHPDKAIAEIEG